MWYCSRLDESDNDDKKNEEIEDEFDNYVGQKAELVPQGVNPRKGWSYRGVHKVFFIFYFYYFVEICLYSVKLLVVDCKWLLLWWLICI